MTMKAIWNPRALVQGLRAPPSRQRAPLLRRALCSAGLQAQSAVDKYLKTGLHTSINGFKDHLPLRKETLPLGGREISLVLPTDVDQVIDMYIALTLMRQHLPLPLHRPGEGREDRDPYWTRPWPSAIALAEQILRRPELVRGMRVADLGCGLGIAGLAAALAGAKEVVMLDREPLALQCALLGALASGIDAQSPEEFDQASKASTSGADRAQSGAAASTSAPPAPSGSAAPRRHLVSAREFDWCLKVPKGLQDFDVVMACDVLYEDFSVDPLAKVIPDLLSIDHSRLVLADPPTRTKKNRDRFVSLMEAAGFRLEESALEDASLDGTTPEAEDNLFGMVGKDRIKVQLMTWRRLGALSDLDSVGVKPRR